MSAKDTELRSHILALYSTGAGPADISRTLTAEGKPISRQRVHAVLKEYDATGLPSAGAEMRAELMREFFGATREQIAQVEGLSARQLQRKGVASRDVSIAQTAQAELMATMVKNGATISEIAKLTGRDRKSVRRSVAGVEG